MSAYLVLCDDQIVAADLSEIVRQHEPAARIVSVRSIAAAESELASGGYGTVLLLARSGPLLQSRLPDLTRVGTARVVLLDGGTQRPDPRWPPEWHVVELPFRPQEVLAALR